MPCMELANLCWNGSTRLLSSGCSLLKTPEVEICKGWTDRLVTSQIWSTHRWILTQFQRGQFLSGDCPGLDNSTEIPIQMHWLCHQNAFYIIWYDPCKNSRPWDHLSNFLALNLKQNCYMSGSLRKPILPKASHWTNLSSSMALAAVSMVNIRALKNRKMLVWIWPFFWSNHSIKVWNHNKNRCSPVHSSAWSNVNCNLHCSNASLRIINGCGLIQNWAGFDKSIWPVEILVCEFSVLIPVFPAKHVPVDLNLIIIVTSLPRPSLHPARRVLRLGWCDLSIDPHRNSPWASASQNPAIEVAPRPIYTS